MREFYALIIYGEKSFPEANCFTLKKRIANIPLSGNVLQVYFYGLNFCRTISPRFCHVSVLLI